MKAHIILKSEVWVWKDPWLQNKVTPVQVKGPNRDRVALTSPEAKSLGVHKVGKVSETPTLPEGEELSKQGFRGWELSPGWG